MGISILLGKEGRAHQHHKLVVDQGLRLPTAHQQNLQHHQDEPQVEPQHLIGALHLISPQPLIELQRHRLASHQHHRQIDRHHQTDLLLQIDHLHHRAHRALAVLAEVAEEVEDDKYFCNLSYNKKEAVQNEQPLFFIIYHTYSS